MPEILRQHVSVLEERYAYWKNKKKPLLFPHGLFLEPTKQ